MSRIRVLIALLAVGLLAIPVTGAAAKPGKSKKATTVKVSRGATTLALDAGTAQALTSLGLSVAPIGPARATADGIAFPVTNGRLNRTSYAGQIRHTGGLRLASSSTHVDLNNFRIVVDDAPDLTAQVGDQRISIADLDLSGATITASGGKLTITGVVVKLSDAAAAALNQAFGTDAFTGGLTLGTASVSTRIKK